MSETQEHGNAAAHELSWMLSDALDLLSQKRRYSALLILLCAVDALARRRFPKTTRVKQRFEEFLKSKMRRPGRPQLWNIFVPQRNELLAFEHLFYKYLRNPMVHEGARMELDHPKGYAVQIDWHDLPRGVKVDGVNNRVVLGGELILNILIDAVSEGLKEDTTPSG